MSQKCLVSCSNWWPTACSRLTTSYPLSEDNFRPTFVRQAVSRVGASNIPLYTVRAAAGKGIDGIREGSRKEPHGRLLFTVIPRSRAGKVMWLGLALSYLVCRASEPFADANGLVHTEYLFNPQLPDFLSWRHSGEANTEHAQTPSGFVLRHKNGPVVVERAHDHAPVMAPQVEVEEKIRMLR